MPLPTDLPTGTVPGEPAHTTGHNTTNARVNAIAAEVNAHEAATAGIIELVALDVPDDGTTDARTALDAALAGLSDGATVGFPSGKTILISDNVEFPVGVTDVTILGRGATLKLDPAAAAGSYALSLLGDGARVEGLFVNCSDVTDATGIRIRGNRQTVTDCTFTGCPSGGVYVQDAAADFTIANCQFTGNGYGVLFADDSTAGPGALEGNRFDPSTRGDAIEINTPTGRAHNITVSGNVIDGFTGAVDHGIGIGIAHASAIAVTGNTVTGCLLDGVHIEDDTRGVSVSGNTITNCGRAGVSVQVGAGTVAPTDWTIAGNTIIGCGGTSGPAAIAIEGGVAVTDGAIAGNTIGGCGRAGATFYGIDLGYQSTDIAVTGNAVRDSVGATTAGIRASTLSRVTLTGNAVSGHGSGVRIESDTTAVTLTGNLLGGNTAALDESSLGVTSDYVKAGNTPDSINDGAVLSGRLDAIDAVVDPDSVNFPGGLHVLGDEANKVGYLGYFSNVGAGLENYRGDHATRAGEFRFIFGGDTDSGAALFIHSDAAQTFPQVFAIGPAGAGTALDVEITDSTKGVILKSPDGTRYRITVANGGTLSVTAA